MIKRIFDKYLSWFSSPWRFIIITIITLTIYVLFIKTLFVDHRIIVSVAYLFALFFFLHFLYIDIKRFSFWNIAWISWIICCLCLFIVWSPDWHIISAILAIHVGFLLLIWYLSWVIQERVHFVSVSYFTTWWYIFTVLAALTYWLTLLWLYSKFPFSCWDLSSASQQVIDVFTHPFKIWLHTAEDWKKQSSSFFTKLSVQEFLIGDSSSLAIQDTIEDTTPKWSWLLGKLGSYKLLMVDQVIKDKNTVNMWMCDYLLKEITKRYADPNFQFSLIILIFLLLYPFIRIGFWVMSFVWLALFKILYWLKIYKPYTIDSKIETIK